MIQSCFLYLISCFSLMSNAERPVQNGEGRYKVPITLDTRCKKQEIRLSSFGIKMLPKDHDSILFLESNLLLLPNVER